MYVNKEKVKKLMEKKADGNYRKFARMLNLDVAQLYRVINSDSLAGPKFLGKLKKYCDEHNLDFDEYIFLDEPLHVVNEKEKRR